VSAATQKLNGSINNEAMAGAPNMNTRSEGGRLHAAIPQPARMILSRDTNAVPALTAGAKKSNPFVINSV
jgi:hypothetical protein